MHIVPINMPFLIGVDIFMEHGMQMDFNNQEKWKIPLHCLSGHVYIRPKMIGMA